MLPFHTGACQRLREKGRQLWENGLTDKEIAEAVGCSRTTVRRFRYQNDLATNSWGVKTDLIDEIGWPMYRSGSTDIAIAEKVGCSRFLVQRWRVKNKLPSNCPTGSEDWKATLPNLERDAKLITLHAGGLTDEELSEAMGVSRNAIKCRRLRLGLKYNRERDGSRWKLTRENDDD